MIRLDLVEVGSRVAYEDMANPRREGRVVEILEHGGETTPGGLPLPGGTEYRVVWEDAEGETTSDLRQHGWTLLTDLPGSISDGADVIHAYTRLDAIRDGTLVPTPDLVPDEPAFAIDAGFVGATVALTAAVAALVRPTSEEADRYHQDVKGRLWDVLLMARIYRPRPIPDEGATWVFRCIFQLAGPERSRWTQRARPVHLRLKAVIGPGDEGEPVVTIMLPEED